VQPRRERLLHLDEMVPGPELPAVRMPRQLKIESGLLGRRRRARLVSAENASHAGWAAGQCGGRIAGVFRVNLGGVEIVDTREDQVFAARADDHVLVGQWAQPETAELAEPVVGAAVVFVVAGDD